MLSTPEVQKKLKKLNDGCGNVIIRYRAMAGSVQPQSWASADDDNPGEACGLRVFQCQRVTGKECVSTKPEPPSCAFWAEHGENQSAIAEMTTAQREACSRLVQGSSRGSNNPERRGSRHSFCSWHMGSKYQSSSWDQKPALA